MRYHKYQAYIALAHDLQSDNAEWAVFTGKRALEAAEAKVKRWCDQSGAWVGQVRKVEEDCVFWVDPSKS